MGIKTKSYTVGKTAGKTIVTIKLNNLPSDLSQCHPSASLHFHQTLLSSAFGLKTPVNCWIAYGQGHPFSCLNSQGGR